MSLVRTSFFAGFAILLLGGTGRAGQLTIDANDLIYPAGGPAPSLVVSLGNPGETTDPLLGWMLGLQITPDAGALGSLQFAGFAVPSSYILAGNSVGIATSVAFPATLINPISDMSSDLSGEVVPKTGSNLVSLSLVASPGARGNFSVFAFPDLFKGSIWFSSDVAVARDFANVPFGGGSVLLATVHVTPEPAAWLLAMFGFAIVVGSRRCLQAIR